MRLVAGGGEAPNDTGGRRRAQRPGWTGFGPASILGPTRRLADAEVCHREAGAGSYRAVRMYIDGSGHVVECAYRRDRGLLDPV
jgi:hypothetical protein